MSNGGFYEGPDGRLYREDGSVIPQITVTLREPGFDIEGARRSGWGDDEIVDHLGEQNPDFDVEGARQSGYSDAEIGQFLSTGEGFSPSPYGAVGAIPRGINTALASIAGAPADILNAVGSLGPMASNAIFGTEFQPVNVVPGGSEQIRAGMNAGISGLAQALGGTGDYNATYEGLSQLPPDERWGAVAGEVIGGSVPFAMAPLAAGAARSAASLTAPQVLPTSTSAGSVASSGIDNILRTAGQMPGRFAAGEAAAIGGAAQGGALAEILAPGNELARMGGEMTGAVLSPTALAGRLAGGAGRSVQNLLSSFTPSGRDRRAAEYVVQAFQRTGEDPTQVLEALRRAQDLPASGTVGQVTGSPTVIAIENQLAGQSPQFASARGELGRDGLESLISSADRLAQTGNPDDLVAAARLRETAFNDMMAGRLSRAQSEAQEAISRVGTSGQPGQAAASDEAATILGRALDDARNIETDLWSQIDRTVPIEPNAVLGSYAEGRSRLLPDENLNPAIEGIIARMSEGQPVTSNELLILRSRALEFARTATSGTDPDRTKAAIYGMIADGALADLANQMSGNAVDVARSFSRSMHENFTQTFAGRGVASTAGGGDFIAPELLLERAFGPGGTRGDIQLEQLQQAAEFPQLGGPPEQTGLGPQMRGAQEDFLRSTAIARGTNPETGAANPVSLARFLAVNETTLGRFPEVQSDLASALSAQRAAGRVVDRGQYASQVLGADSPFGRLLQGRSPRTAVESALRGDQGDYMSLVNVARGGGPEAMDGLMASTLDTLLKGASTSGGDFSFARFNQALTNPRTAWSESPLEMMVSQGVMDQGSADRLLEIIRRGNLIENPPNANFDASIVSAPDAITDLVTRIIGARIGSAGAAGSSGHALIAAGAGSRTATNIFGRMPQTRIQQALIEMVKDPALFEAAISRVPSPEMQRDLARQINAALINAGIDTGYEDPYNSGNSLATALERFSL